MPVPYPLGKEVHLRSLPRKGGGREHQGSNPHARTVRYARRETGPAPDTVGGPALLPGDDFTRPLHPNGALHTACHHTDLVRSVYGVPEGADPRAVPAGAKRRCGRRRARAARPTVHNRAPGLPHGYPPP